MLVRPGTLMRAAMVGGTASHEWVHAADLGAAGLVAAAESD